MSSRWTNSPDPVSTRDVERRLRADVAVATIEASSEHRRRTFTALARTAPGEDRARRSPRLFTLAPSYAAACCILLVSATAAVMHTPAPTSSSTSSSSFASSRALPVVIGIDTTRLDATVQEHARRLGASMESPLVIEARSILEDAYKAAGSFLASLPLDTVRIKRTSGIVDTGPTAHDD